MCQYTIYQEHITFFYAAIPIFLKKKVFFFQ